MQKYLLCLCISDKQMYSIFSSCLVAGDQELHLDAGSKISVAVLSRKVSRTIGRGMTLLTRLFAQGVTVLC